MTQKHIWRPFWSYHIQKTEKWLNDMAAEGYALTDFKPKLSRFSFAADQGETNRFHTVAFDSTKQHLLPAAMKEDGWEVAWQKQKWGIYANRKEEKDISTGVVRDDLLSRNSKISIVWWLFFLYIIFSVSMQLTMFLPLFLADSMTVTREASPFWIITYTVFALQPLIVGIGIYSLLELKKESRRLTHDSGRFENDAPFIENVTADTETTKTFWKPGWNYGPDKLEAWLEEKERNGWHLILVKKGGTRFQFARAGHSHFAYSVLYEGRGDINAHQFHREAGWERVYVSGSQFQQWSIWRKEYSEGEVKPEINGDAEIKQQAAKRVARHYTLMFSPLILIFGFNFFSFMLPRMLETGYFQLSGIEQFNTTVHPLVMAAFLSYIIRAWLFYGRVKRQADEGV